MSRSYGSTAARRGSCRRGPCERNFATPAGALRHGAPSMEHAVQLTRSVGCRPELYPQRRQPASRTRLVPRAGTAGEVASGRPRPQWKATPPRRFACTAASRCQRRSQTSNTSAALAGEDLGDLAVGLMLRQAPDQLERASRLKRGGMLHAVCRRVGRVYGSKSTLLELSRSLPISSSAGRISCGSATSEPARTS
jgi:hypothetical protein